MSFFRYDFIISILFIAKAFAQPSTNSGWIVKLDFDANGTTDFVYSTSADKVFDVPEDWQVTFGLQPWGNSRIVRANGSRVRFLPDESISDSRQSLTNYLPDPPRPPSKDYSVPILAYRARFLGEWQFTTLIPAYENESELLFGLRLVLTTGTHHGWVRLSRVAVDSHTPFDLVGYAVHPVPGESILAGQPPPLPPLRTQMDAQGLNVSWDARWGPLILESTTNLVPPITWETYVEEAGGPVTISTDNESRFYRLRTP